mmetsp:Transcript_44643/g.78493  ORF Transcript_44643/g.78493 Transcript_44643/m.78493 type:complete len:1495 (+) Transcript_44643:94-4578(+)
MPTYSVGFKVHEAKSLQTSDGSRASCFVVVECGDKRFQTQTLDECMEIAAWNEACTWPGVEMSEKEFKSAYIEFSVYERRWFTRNYLIGKASLQLSTVNNRKRHVFSRVPLQLMQEGETDMKGLLNAMVFVLASGQSAPSAADQEKEAVEEDDDDPGDDSKKKGFDQMDLRTAVLSKDVKPPAGRPYYVKIQIHRVEDLARLSSGWAPSPFITVEFNGKQVKTSIAPSVFQYNFRECAQIPVMTPIYEDTILIKLWSHNLLSPDELLAQGLVSFSQLRNRAMETKWFNLYGWDYAETPDLERISAKGEYIQPNVFKGRILIDGQVMKLEDEDLPLQAAQSTFASQPNEPSQKQYNIYGDVYMVVGLQNRSCKVQLQYGLESTETEWVTYEEQETNIDPKEKIADNDSEMSEEVGRYGDSDQLTYFNFSQKAGRMEPILIMTPDDADSQPDLLFSVWCWDYLGAEQRVGFCRHKMNEFTKYELGNPRRPKFLTLSPMPGRPHHGASLLITVEYSNVDDGIRPDRKKVRQMLFIVRAYCFMARSIDYNSGDEPANYALHISCSGISKKTKWIQQVRPMWMEAVDLKVVLMSDSRNEPPTVEPISIMLEDIRNVSSIQIGKAIAEYSIMRSKNTLGVWNPYSLDPKWIKVNGGEYGNTPVGEILIGFELLPWKSREVPSLQKKIMWPQPADDFREELHYCRLRKATLHFAMMGLRDLPRLHRSHNVGLVSGKVHVDNPQVTIHAPSFRDPQDEEEFSDAETEPLKFKYQEVVEGGDGRLKECQLRKWISKRGVYAQSSYFEEQEFMNFEFLQYKKMCIEIPDKMIFQPYLVIKVEELPSETGVTSLVSSLVGPTFIGESLQSLEEVLPCCWFPGVDTQGSYDDQFENIQKSIEYARDEAAVYDVFEQISKEELEAQLKQIRQEQVEEKMRKAKHLVKVKEVTTSRLDNTALPIELRHKGGHPHPRIEPMSLEKLNCQLERGFSPREGPPLRATEDSFRSVPCKLEHSTEFRKNFWFQNFPLLRNHDVLDIFAHMGHPDRKEYDFNFGPHHGFVKCAYMLVDGFEEEPEKNSEDEAFAEEEDDDDKIETDEDRLKRSFEVDEELLRFAFDKEKFHKKFKSADNLPARINVRIYLLKANCIYAKGTGFPDPFVQFQLGRIAPVSQRHRILPKPTSTPALDRFEERTIQLPEDGRLEISLSDAQDLAVSDALIGSTVLDLEDRWHSEKWQRINARQQFPVETRSLFRPGEEADNHGNLAMFIEMIDSTQAADRDPLDLRAAANALIVLRVVIRDTEDFNCDEEEGKSYQIKGMLQCQEYQGGYAQQESDIHYNAKGGKAKYNFRFLYVDIQAPVETCMLQINLEESHMLSANNIIGSATIDMKKYIDMVAGDMDKRELEKVPIPMKPVGEDDEVGFVEVEMTILSATEANEPGKEAGYGRSDPNANPPLICPPGRDWGDFLEAFGFSFPWPSWWKKALALIIPVFIFLAGVVIMKQMGLL